MATNRDWMERHAQALAGAVGRPHDPRFGTVFVRGKGARLWDVEGREYLDLTCGYSAANFGHTFAPLIEAAQASLQQIGHLTGDAHPAKIELAEQLIELCGFTGGVRRAESSAGAVIFNATGARGIETAWKAAVTYRPGKLLVLSPGFHGRSIATSAISATSRVGPKLDPASFQVEPAERYPYCGRCPLGLEYPRCDIACGEALWGMLRQRAAEYSAVLVEPALGARGYVFPPSEFFQRLRGVTQATGMLMIADEIQTGLGRCGGWLLSQRQGWQPDIVVLGKSLGGGVVPLSAVVGRAAVLNAIPSGAESETFAATPLACAVALQVLAELRDRPWIARGEAIGAALRQGFAQHGQRAAWGIEQVEGVGAVCALEFARGPLAKGLRQAESHCDGLKQRVAPELAARSLAEAMFRAGLLVHLTGPESTRIVLLPPLTLTDAELSRIQAF